MLKIICLVLNMKKIKEASRIITMPVLVRLKTVPSIMIKSISINENLLEFLT